MCQAVGASPYSLQYRPLDSSLLESSRIFSKGTK
jgi:hypothetical protein